MQLLPPNQTVALYVREVTGGALERIDEYIRLASQFDSRTGSVAAEVPASVFSQYRFLGKYEAVLLIGSSVTR